MIKTRSTLCFLSCLLLSTSLNLKTVFSNLFCLTNTVLKFPFFSVKQIFCYNSNLAKFKQQMSQVCGLWISQMPWMNWLDWNWQSWKFGLKRSNNGKVRIVEEEEAFLILQRFERSLIRPPGRFTSPLRWKSYLFFQFFQLKPPWSFCEKFGEKLGKFGKLSVLSSRRAGDACRGPLYIVGMFAFSLSRVHQSVLHSGRLGEWVSGCGMFGRYRKPTLATVREAGPLVELGAHL